MRYQALLTLFALCLSWGACSKTQSPPDDRATRSQTSSSVAAGQGEPVEKPEPEALTLPAGFARRTVDLEEMVKRRNVRALVIINPIGFFFQNGRPQGIQYEALQEFEKFLNQRLKTGKVPVKVVFLPMRLDQLEPALTEGLGDIVAQGVTITPERTQRFAFSVPIQENVSEVVVTGADSSAVTSFDDLAGKPIYVNPLTAYYENLKKLSEGRQKAGKSPLEIKATDQNLFDDDLVEMVNANLIPATVINRGRAALWAQVLPNVKVHEDLVVASGGKTAWVMRSNNPQLKGLVDEFLRTHAAGTSFGNTLLQRYLQNTQWIRNSTSEAEIQKFKAYTGFFRKYAREYQFDYLLLTAQGYQESLLDQQKKSPTGAVGVMQVIPKFAAADPIDISNVEQAENNIHAGVKMLRAIADTYFNDPGVDPLNKTLFTFASYNAGPNRIAHLRKRAELDGLDPNKWFGNVELEVAKDVGQETVIYVGNIYKYYIAYKMATGDTKLHGVSDPR